MWTPEEKQALMLAIWASFTTDEAQSGQTCVSQMLEYFVFASPEVARQNVANFFAARITTLNARATAVDQEKAVAVQALQEQVTLCERLLDRAPYEPNGESDPIA